MNTLILDTSTDRCLLALANGDQILAQEVFYHHNLLSKLLLPSIQTLIKKNNLTPNALSSIAVGIGPGSYTGTRLGVAVGKGLSFALNIPIQSFPSPLAFLPPSEKGNFAFIIPTRSHSFFVLQGSSFAQSVRQNNISIVPDQELDIFIGSADFLVAFSQDFFSSDRKQKPCFSAQPNFNALLIFLSEEKRVKPEDVQLLYLHESF